MRERALLKGLWKPQLVAGVELMPFLFILFMSLEIIINAADIWLKIAGAIFGFSLYLVLRRLNKKEPHMFSIIIRYIAFQKFYLNVAKHPSRPPKIYNKGT